MKIKGLTPYQKYVCQSLSKACQKKYDGCQQLFLKDYYSYNGQENFRAGHFGARKDIWEKPYGSWHAPKKFSKYFPIPEI